ncbi:D-allose-binding periplasmic protein precursor [Paraliobacillus sp. PM-2]|uniref:sugar-binding protein n=1 Tax=Paraliobacillus sp. PM-2 TaxID=1462524 RepID=UPI00061CCDF8|nr:sugar-binding protein [Paraliobacillus sp. PM-2]CQR45946.1 D-allose-binding periplasmic protein precursor [Paraliobacillus sp. PM-2]
MSRLKKYFIYGCSLSMFLISFLLMIYYGKETFYLEGQLNNKKVYDYHFVLITEEVGNDYWRLIESGAREQALANNVYLEYIGPEQADLKERLNTFDRMIAANVDGIFIQGLPGNRFTYLVEKAKDQSIPVATIDADAPESARNFYVGTDNYQAGYLAGKTLIKHTSGTINIGIIVGSMESLNQQLRLKGLKEAIASVKRIKIISIDESTISEIGAAQATYALLKNNPEINALFGLSALDGIGIVQGVEEMNPSNYPFIVAFDTLPETISLIEKDKIFATVVQYPNQMGRQAIELMLNLKNNQAVDAFNYTNTGVLLKSDITNGGILAKGDPN